MIISNVPQPSNNTKIGTRPMASSVIPNFPPYKEENDYKKSQTPQGEQRHRKDGCQEKRHTRQAESRNCTKIDCGCSTIESRGETGSYSKEGSAKKESSSKEIVNRSILEPHWCVASMGFLFERRPEQCFHVSRILLVVREDQFIKILLHSDHASRYRKGLFRVW